MGRRAKNKQGSPEPIESKAKSTVKRTGKRKADVGDDVGVKFTGRPPKKARADDVEALPVAESKDKKSKQHTKPAKIIPTGSDFSDGDFSEREDSDGPVTMANMEARSRALDAQALADAELDVEELQDAALGESDHDMDNDIDIDGEEDGNGEIDAEPFHLLTPEEREEEKKKGGPDVHVVQRRIRECVRVLGKSKKLAAKGRCVIVRIACARLYSMDHDFTDRDRNIQTNWFRTSQATTVITTSLLKNCFNCSPLPR
jgi:hypothetical protein